MSSRRTVILVAAVLIGVIAAVALYSYVDNLRDEAYGDATLVEAFRVKNDIPQGTPGEQALEEGFIESTEVPQEFRPATALTNTDTLKGKVALSNLSAGQVVVDGMFVDPKVAQVSFSERIPAGQVAITISVDTVRGVAGLLVPGDKVNIMTTDDEGRQRFLFQNVNILAIGQTAAPQAGDTAAATNPGSNLLTFAVPPVAAERIAFVSSNVYLTLVPPDNQPKDVPPVGPDNLFGGDLTPYGNKG